MNKTLNEQLYLPKQTHGEETQFVNGDIHFNYGSEDLKAEARRIKKRRALGFEGAQYRRVRKFAEEHNRKFYSAYHTNGEEPLIKGLNHIDGFTEMEKINITKGPAHFFPTTSLSQNKKVRKGSVEVNFRRKIKPSLVNVQEVNLWDPTVRCEGKQI